jgi:integrase
MARRSEGLKLVRRETGLYYARFTFAGRRYLVPTGERDPGTAQGAAARIYNDVASGRWAPGRRQVAAPANTPFDEVAARWLAHIRPSIEEKTFRLYRDTYVGSHFAPFFKTIERLTTVGAQDYISARLRKVTRQTLKHELSPLRRLARWAHSRGYLAQMPQIETPGRRVLGTPVENARKRVSLIFTAEEIAAVVSHLPESWSAPRAQTPYPVRARYVVAWETALRPQTISKLAAPDDYRRGSMTLQIRDEVDKNRFGRELPLSDAARSALDSVCPAEGLIFGKHDCLMLVRRAAAGIDAYRADRISDYDFRHSAATHLGRSSDNLPGVMYLLGHKQPATTARYMRPQKDAALEVLLAASAAKLSTDSGSIVATERREPASVDSPAPFEIQNDYFAVRGRGLEPRWLLTASTSS